MLKIAFQITTLLSVLIFLAQMLMGLIWQIALMRTAIAYLVLMLIFYLSILLITITSGRRFVLSNEKETEESATSEGNVG